MKQALFENLKGIIILICLDNLRKQCKQMVIKWRNSNISINYNVIG